MKPQDYNVIIGSSKTEGFIEMKKEFSIFEHEARFIGSDVSIQYSGKKDSNDKQGPYFYKGVIASIVLDENDLKVSVTINDAIQTFVWKINESSINRMDRKITVMGANMADMYIAIQAPESSAATVTIDLLPYKGNHWSSDIEYLIFYRHGDYEKLRSNEYGLSVRGRKQIITMSHKLKNEFDASSAIIFSSTARRACESSTLTANEFGIQWEKYIAIGDESGDNFDFSELLHLLVKRSSEYRTLIVSSHMPLCGASIRYINEDIFGDSIIPPLSFETGSALLVKLKDRSYKFFK